MWLCWLRRSKKYAIGLKTTGSWNLPRPCHNLQLITNKLKPLAEPWQWSLLYLLLSLTQRDLTPTIERYVRDRSELRSPDSRPPSLSKLSERIQQWSCRNCTVGLGFLDQVPTNRSMSISTCFYACSAWNCEDTPCGESLFLSSFSMSHEWASLKLS